jgi:hypothetical protein
MPTCAQAMYLHSHVDSWRNQLLPCSIKHLLQSVGNATPLDVYVFVRAEAHSSLSSQLQQSLGANATRVCVLPIAPEQWAYQLPRARPYQLPNNTNRYRDYLVMVRACVAICLPTLNVCAQ